MDNPGKMTTFGTQDEEKQNKNTTQYVLNTTIRKKTQIKYGFSKLLLAILFGIFEWEDPSP
jgi:hypothetical protein